MSERRLAFLLALSLCLAMPAAPALAAPPPAVDYQADRQTLAVPLSAGGVPSLVELANPPRLVVDLPGTTAAAARDQAFATGRVSRLVVEKVGTHARVTLFLRQPVKGAWSLGYQDGNLLVSLPPMRGETTTKTPTPKPTPKPTLKPTPKPTAKPTPKPKPSAKPRPTATPVAKPTLRPLMKPSTRPTPLAIVAPTTAPSVKPRPTVAPIVASPKPTPTPATVASAKPSTAPTVVATATPAAPSPKPATPLPTPQPTLKPATPLPKPSGAAPLAIAPVKPAQGDFAKLNSVTYDEDVRFMQISVSRPVTPHFAMAGHRLTADFPGTVVGDTITRQFPGALVQEVVAYQQAPTQTRVIVTFARGIGKNWGLKQSGGNVVLVFDHKPVNAPSIDTPEPAASQKPVAKPTPKPPTKPTPRPTPVVKPTAHPTVKPTMAHPTPAPTVKGTNTFTGSVFHINTGEPLAGVHVSIGGHTATTDAAGRFSVQGLPAGRLQVVVTASGFATQSFDILVPEDKSLSLNLVPALH